MSAADRSGTERIRRLKAIALLNGPITGAIDYTTVQSIDFGKRAYLRQLANGAVVKETCCSSQCSEWKATAAKGLLFFAGRAAPNDDTVGDPGGVTEFPGGVAYGNNIWVAIGIGGNIIENVLSGKNIQYSTDGVSWQESFGTPFGTQGIAFGVAYGNNRWVAVGNGKDDDGYNNGKNILYSDDGVGWQESFGTPFSTNGRGIGVAYGNNRWVAVGAKNNSTSTVNNILYSDDNGVSWQESSGMPFGSGGGLDVAYGNNRWVAVGRNVDGTANGKNILYSDDGVSWQESSGTPFGTRGQGVGVSYGNNLWVAVGGDSTDISTGNRKNILYSTDGVSWQESPGGTFDGEFTSGVDIAYDSTHNRWVAIGFGINLDNTVNINNILYTNNPAGC